jgi:hypothetical protein
MFSFPQRSWAATKEEGDTTRRAVAAAAVINAFLRKVSVSACAYFSTIPQKNIQSCARSIRHCEGNRDFLSVSALKPLGLRRGVAFDADLCTSAPYIFRILWFLIAATRASFGARYPWITYKNDLRCREPEAHTYFAIILLVK